MPALDGIRALAITLVVIHHTAFVVPGLHDWVAGGFLGVDVFFVLSGFLVTALLVVRGRGPGHLRAFYARRVGRLGPALVVLMLAITAITLIGRTPAPGLGATWLGTMTATTNWLMLDGTTISLYAGHLWSLAVEGQFYVVWPLVLGLLAAWLRGRTLVAVVVALAFLAAGIRAGAWLGGEGWVFLYLRTDSHLDALLIGAALALAWPMLRRPRGRSATLIGGAALLALLATAILVPASSPALALGGATVLAVAVAALIAAADDRRGPVARLLSLRPVVVLGRLSYSLYLWHYVVFVVIVQASTGFAPFGLAVLGWVLSLVFAANSYRFVEGPVRRWVARRLARADAPSPLGALPDLGVPAADVVAGIGEARAAR